MSTSFAQQFFYNTDNSYQFLYNLSVFCFLAAFPFPEESHPINEKTFCESALYDPLYCRLHKYWKNQLRRGSSPVKPKPLNHTTPEVMSTSFAFCFLATFSFPEASHPMKSKHFERRLFMKSFVDVYETNWKNQLQKGSSQVKPKSRIIISPLQYVYEFCPAIFTIV